MIHLALTDDEARAVAYCLGYCLAREGKKRGGPDDVFAGDHVTARMARGVDQRLEGAIGKKKEAATA